MAGLPWFKFYSADFLTDGDADDLPLEAQALLVRMWCVCHLHGSLPDDEKEVLRKTGTSGRLSNPLSYSLCKSFFNLRDGRLYSKRMEEEQHKSDIARNNGKQRGKANSSATSSADCSATSSAQSQSQSQINPPLPPNGNPDLLLDICNLHPDSDHYGSVERLPGFLTNLLIPLVQQDGEKVKIGTAAFRKAHDEKPEDQRKFMGADYLKARNFFEQRRYLEYANKPAKKPEPLSDYEFIWAKKLGLDWKGNPDEIRKVLKTGIPQWQARAKAEAERLNAVN